MTREDLISWQESFAKTYAKYPPEAQQAINETIKILQEPERKHGYWIEGKTHYEAIECHCSECDQLMTTYLHKRMKYCPNCGAIMDGKEPIKGEQENQEKA